MTGANVHKSFHPLLMEVTDEEKTYIDNQHFDEFLSIIRPVTTANKAAFFTVDAILDLESKDGLDIAQKFLVAMENIPGAFSSNKEKISLTYRIIPNSPSARSSLVGNILRLRTIPIETITQVLLAFLREHNQSISSSQEVDDITKQFTVFLNQFTDIDDTVRNLILKELEEISSSPPETENDPAQMSSLGGYSSQNLIVANGRVFVTDTKLVIDDIKLLINLEMSRSKAITNAFRPHVSGEEELYSAVAKTSVYFSNMKSASKKEKRTHVVSQLNMKKSSRNKNALQFMWNNEVDDNSFGDRVLKVSSN